MRILQSLRSLRQFRHAPLYSVAVIGSLALGIGATCAAYAVVKRAFLDPLPYHHADRLVTIETLTDGRESAVSFFVTEDLRESPLFEDVSAFRFSTVTYEAPEAAERLAALEVTPVYFSLLGVTPIVGSVWNPGAADAAILSWAFFERALGSDASKLGQRVAIDGVPRQIVGVMPRQFVAPFSPQADVWLPLNTQALLADTARARRTVSVIARLAPGVSTEDARAHLTVFSENQRKQHPGVHDRDTWFLTALRDDLVGPSRTVLFGAGAAAALLMLIVWANIAGLTAAQAAAFRRAHAVRVALGATVGRLLRERFGESVVLSASGTILGLWLAQALVTLAAGYQQQFLNNMARITLDPATIALGLSLGTLTAAMIVIVPHRSVRVLSVGDLLGTGRTLAGNERLTRLRSTLVLVQVAIAMVLMISAGLLVRTVRNLSATAMGFDSAHVTTINVMLPTSRYQGTTRHVQFENEVLERLRGVPGVIDASASVGFPAAGAMGARLTILGRPDDTGPTITYFSVAPQFFSFLGVPILEGRDILDTDGFDAPRVVVINQTMARVFWPNGDAIGARVKIGAGAPTDREIIVVGIAADVRQNGPTQEVRPTAYGSTLQYSWPRRHFTVRASKPIPLIAGDLRAAVQSVDPLIALPPIRPLDDHIAQQTARHRFTMLILTAFGFVATALCGFGLYAVVALTSQFRRREYAIRVALGANRRSVWWLVVRQALVLAVAGAAVGVGTAALLTDALQSLLHGVEPTDPVTFLSSGVAVVMLAIAAALLPAWRAGRVDPVETLRAE